MNSGWPGGSDGHLMLSLALIGSLKSSYLAALAVKKITLIFFERDIQEVDFPSVF